MTPSSLRCHLDKKNVQPINKENDMLCMKHEKIREIQQCEKEELQPL